MISAKSFNHSSLRAVSIGFSLLTAAAVLPVSAVAASNGWSVDATSAARIYLGSSTVPESANVGVARVTGKIDLNAEDPASPVFDLSIFPSGEDWSAALVNGDLPAGYVPDAGDNTLLTFKSQRITRTRGGLQVTGELTLTQVVRSVTADANEGYSGPVYGAPAIHKTTREVTLNLPGLEADRASATLTPAALKNMLQRNNEMSLSASSRVPHQAFPELTSAVAETNWPTIVANETCSTSSSPGGQDYSGQNCSGTVIAAAREDNCVWPGGGQDFSGPVCTPPAGDQTTIVLRLKLTRADEGPSAGLLGSGVSVQ